METKKFKLIATTNVLLDIDTFDNINFNNYCHLANIVGENNMDRLFEEYATFTKFLLKGFRVGEMEKDYIFSLIVDDIKSETLKIFRDDNSVSLKGCILILCGENKNKREYFTFTAEIKNKSVRLI